MAKVSLRAYNREIESMIDSGHLDEAIANCRHILKSFPKHLETYRLLGKAYLEYKRHPEAVDIFLRVLAAAPGDFVAHVGMSIISDEQNKLDDAIWHMERAFETQPSNAAIQAELQRLYGQRDGVQPPRIRMTRGALAHMYVQGELYPQAISEIKSVLKEDGGRVDMQALLARAYYRSGLKNEAAEAASVVLRTYPYCLDANRVLLEILSADRLESAQVYRQRVVELDPYAAHVTGTVFQSDEVPDAAVSLERLEWNGQPVGLQPDWGTTQAISREPSAALEPEPDWLKSVFDEPPTQPPPPDRPAVVPAFDVSGSSAPGEEPQDEIPDFLRAAGWGKSTGAFDESKSASEEPEAQPSIEKGELPDWIKAMAPVEPEQPAEEDEELPDWINKIGAGVAPVPSDEGGGPDWLSQIGEPSAEEPRPSEPEPDWLRELGQTEQQPSAAPDEQPDWLKALGGDAESTPSAEPAEESAAMGQQPPLEHPEVPGSEEIPAWMEQPQAGAAQAEADLDWLRGLGSETGPELGPQAEEADWLKQLGAQAEPSPEAAESAPASSGVPSIEQPGRGPEPAVPEVDKFGITEQEQEDTFAWLESLAARQGASEGLLTKPEERREEEPDWVKRAKGLTPEQAAPPTGSVEELGRSEQEQEDSFAWLESLAARQGASEGLLTKPEERSEQEPDWVKQARDLSAGEQPAEPVPAEEPPSALDDTVAWLKSLDEERAAGSDADATGIWLKGLDEELARLEPSQPASKPEGEPEMEMPGWMRDMEEGQAVTEAAPREETAAEEPAAQARPEETAETPPSVVAADAEAELPAWMQNIEEETPEVGVPAAPVMETEPSPQVDDMPEWMQYLEDRQVAEESGAAIGEPAARAYEEQTVEPAEWMGAVEQPPTPSPEVAAEQPAARSEEIPAWLSSLEEEEARAPAVVDEDLPAWLRDERREPPPAEAEPTRPSDWQPVAEQPFEPPPPPPEQVPAPASEVQTEPAAPAVAATPIDLILGQARENLERGDISAALGSYEKLIRKTRFLDEVIHDLREALYRYPVDVGIWQSLGDAYMRANRLQDALDAYTKAEELLR